MAAGYHMILAFSLLAVLIDVGSISELYIVYLHVLCIFEPTTSLL